MGWLPSDRDDVMKGAVPEPFVPATATVPKTVAPSLKVTVPVITPEDGPVTVAVKVTDWPAPDGLALDVRVVVVGAGSTSRFSAGAAAGAFERGAGTAAGAAAPLGGARSTDGAGAAGTGGRASAWTGAGAAALNR